MIDNIHGDYMTLSTELVDKMSYILRYVFSKVAYA